MRSYADAVKSIVPFNTEAMIAAATAHVPSGYRGCAWMHPELDHGKAILRSEEALNCYLAAYGTMHEVKMVNALKNLPGSALTGEYDVVDWGCGQGLASMCLLDVLETGCPGRMPRKITLVDASEVALARARLHVSLKAGRNADVRCIRASLSFGSGDARPAAPASRVVVHLLSNIIDVPGIDTASIAGSIFASGRENYVVCAGHANTMEAADTFCRHLRRLGASVMYEYNEPFAWQLPNGKEFGGDLRLLRCAGAGRSTACCA